jgi:hypothetical protein
MRAVMMVVADVFAVVDVWRMEFAVVLCESCSAVWEIASDVVYLYENVMISSA